MLILGIETTCDETACAVVKDGKHILSNVIHSQHEHIKYGGVVPEIASRSHVEKIYDIAKEAIKKANVSINDLDKIAVAYGPGLSGSISVGISFAEGLALSLSKEIVYINHVKAHLYAPFISNDNIKYPCLGILLSGAHSSIVIIHNVNKYELLGEAIDDAVGEAFDKVARMLSLPYPGGPEVEKQASKGRYVYKFTKCVASEGPFYFSNSGLKTQVMYLVKNENKKGDLTGEFIRDVACSFQNTIFKDIENKVKKAMKLTKIKQVVFGGGVTNSMSFREIMSKIHGIEAFYPGKNLSMDNGAMIAALAFHVNEKQEKLYRVKIRMPWN